MRSECWLAAAAPDAAVVAAGVPAVPPRTALARGRAASVVGTAVDERRTVEAPVPVPPVRMAMPVPAMVMTAMAKVAMPVTAEVPVPMPAMDVPVPMPPVHLIDHAFSTRADLRWRRHRRGRCRSDQRDGQQRRGAQDVLDYHSRGSSLEFVSVRKCAGNDARSRTGRPDHVDERSRPALVQGRCPISSKES